ncbi:MAG: DUF3224 domain-containing protein [Polyangiales bacterium]
MSGSARGTFEIQAQRHPPYDERAGATLARVTFTKQFTGDLVAESNVEMLGAITEVKGSAGYVAIERVVGTLSNKQGSFVLQHSGTMARGAQSLSVTVVPDSATDALRGLSGTMRIDVADGKHHYTFDYAFAD